MSVYGTVATHLSLEVFLESVLHPLEKAVAFPREVTWVIGARICLNTTLTTSTRIQLLAECTTLRHSIAVRRSHGILTMCPSAPAFAIALGPTNPSLIIIAKEPLVFRRRGLSPLLRLLVPTFSLPVAPRALSGPASSRTEMLSYHRRVSLSLATDRRKVKGTR